MGGDRATKLDGYNKGKKKQTKTKTKKKKKVQADRRCGPVDKNFVNCKYMLFTIFVD